ncbi:hypothetical protein O181_124489 [Austropuccinia psidii MF-1]|uniref:Uncharacterized protein n=1 Tax=Austropuccinia psidii MF-1 TaxID=1389203 RepID=A0A9Q3KPI7_9BASI|nr:hypothetical protein [Austropuccinia psidii MF-1]
MPLQHSPPARQARTQAFLTPTPRAPLDDTPEVPQLRAQLDRGPCMEGEAPSRKEVSQGLLDRNTRVAWHSAIRELTWKTPKNKEIKLKNKFL